MISVNAEDFKLKWAEAKGNYESRVRSLLRVNHAVIAARADLDSTELEAHATAYLIDPLLSALNWSLSSEIIVELVTYKQEGRSRRLDYAGVETGSDEVSLLVEAKRPSFSLPIIDARSPNQVGDAPRQQLGYARQIVDYISVHLNFLKGVTEEAPDATVMPKHFTDALAQLRQYYLDLHAQQERAPKRAVLTNGSWLMIFAEPENAFCHGAATKSEFIHLFEDGDSVMRQASVVFDLLERNRCSSLPLPVPMDHIGDHLQNVKVKGISFALHVAVDRQTNSAGPRPILTIDPTLLILTEAGKAWLRVPAGEWLTFPNAVKDRTQHVKRCKAILRELHTEFRELTGRKIGLLKLVDYFGHSAWRDELSVVTKTGLKSYLIVTGNEPHFLKPLIAFEKCQYHTYDGSLAKRVVAAPAGPSEEMVTFQSVGLSHCCVAKRMFDLKSKKGADKKGEAPWRSVQDKGGICKIYEFERFLCCKMCAFEPICIRPMGTRVVCEP